MTFVTAAIQICAGSDRERNLDRAAELVRDAHSASGASLVVLPEVFAWRGPPDEEAAQAEPVPGPITERMGALARELSVHLVLGSLLERTADDPRPYNTSVLLGPDGRIIARYRKLHLFDVDIAGYPRVRESATRAPGNEAVVTSIKPRRDHEPVTLGLSICYDLRFPELYRRLSDSGATLLLVPAAFTAKTGKLHWLELLKARAIENLAYVVGANQFGMGREGVDSYGRSAIIDPWGQVLSLHEEGEGWTAAEIDLERVWSLRSTFPALRHIRRDVFDL